MEKSYDRIYVINLDRSGGRLEKVSNQLEKAGLEFERFPAIDGADVLFKDSSSKKTFTGKDIKNHKAMVEGNIKYSITCDPDSATPTVFQYKPTLHYTLRMPGQIGLWCSSIKLWKEIAKNNYSNVLIFEDDVQIISENFADKLEEYISSLPDSYDIAWFDANSLSLKWF